VSFVLGSCCSWMGLTSSWASHRIDSIQLKLHLDITTQFAFQSLEIFRSPEGAGCRRQKCPSYKKMRIHKTDNTYRYRHRHRQNEVDWTVSTLQWADSEPAPRYLPPSTRSSSFHRNAGRGNDCTSLSKFHIIELN